jgi:Outer membrane lipoprotein
MTDPKRWSEGDEGDELTRQLLVAGQSARLPESERRALWAGIALSLPLAPPPGAAPGPVAAASGVSAYFTKGLIFLAAVTGLTVSASRFWQRAEPVAVHAHTAISAPALLAPPAKVPAAEPTAAPESAPAAVATPSDGKPHLAASSQLREESVAVLEARSALRSGDAARSLALLEQARARFPRGALGQEREALTIQALAQSGDHASARRRAEAFLRAHPQSPYVADVRLVAAQ